MKIVVGGSPGTGSSLLRQMLNRHSDVYCGPELQLFVHPELFSHWDTKKLHLVQPPLLTAPSVHALRGSRLAGKEQQWSEQDVLTLIRNSGSLEEFVDQYFLRPMTYYNKSVWAEKTPENVICFEQVLNTWPDAVVIHMTRDPLDTLASLMARGFPLFYSAARYLFNTSHALKSADNDRYFRVSYEDLVTEPQKTLESLLNSLGLAASEEVVNHMTEPGNPYMVETHRLPGWKSSELEAPNPGSIDRFRNMSEFDRHRIIYATNAMHISGDYASRNHLNIADFNTLFEILGYEKPLPPTVSNDNVVKSLKRELRSYRWKQIKARRLFYEKEKPVEIQSYLQWH